jgi:CheY-like chemotaxis protein
LKKTVLVVEDDPDSREVFCEFLKVAGLDFVAMDNGASALRYLESNPRPSVIVLDMLMPEMDGWQFRRAQGSDPALRDIPLIVVSALKTVERSARLFGASEFLGKPFSSEALLDAIARVA